jgi:hypothetical protein
VSLAEGLAAGEALVRARTEFNAEARGGRPGGEAFDPYVELIARGRDPLAEEFASYAREFFGPLLAHRYPA